MCAIDGVCHCVLLGADRGAMHKQQGQKNAPVRISTCQTLTFRCLRVSKKAGLLHPNGIEITMNANLKVFTQLMI